MGPAAVKLLTGTRLGLSDVRAPKEKLARIRSGIYKLRFGLVEACKEEKYINGLVGQLRFIKQISPRDVSPYIGSFKIAVGARVLSNSAKELLAIPKREDSRMP